ncbi:ubiquitin-conjugating enzyme subfamily protein [Cardiosporidium cionae]|uniref:Ubiquitin-conjugating enzyme subfamily protein n=1 Tax=Cardiosporidium cionae TaxID=476202 RepID=A0ABQ7JEB7_9APIC|nr:ubiquitin-conjugating enzyme subfamily protein [Cardiosporidium cionae]|eukprot:KAF8822351.1 ubiquitin-conjugating enzyme subfamily protein [Cardiosporidium cionae]
MDSTQFPIHLMGRNDLLVDAELARYPSGELDHRRLHHSILPIPSEVLIGQDSQGFLAEVDFSFLQDSLSLYSTLIEYSYMQHYAPHGVYCLPSLESLLEWHCVIFVRKGIYGGGIFKFIIKIDENYPRTSPTTIFISDVFHPLVNVSTGILDITPAFPVWNEEHYIPLVISYVKKIFYEPEFFSSGTSNKEALYLYQDDKKLFLQKVNECVKKSQETIYDMDKHFSINFMKEENAIRCIETRLLSLSHDKDRNTASIKFVDWLLNELVPQNLGSVRG